MKSSRPYLLRALYEWMLDNDATPHLMVDETVKGVQVPAGFDQDGMLILSIAPAAVEGLELGNDFVAFKARFGGKPHSVFVPMVAVKGVFARETGEGMQFLTEPGEPPAEADSSNADEAPSAAKRPGLRVVR